jgi:hypothetical protein
VVSKTAAVLLPGNPALAKEFDDLSFKVSREGKSEWRGLGKSLPSWSVS